MPAAPCRRSQPGAVGSVGPHRGRVLAPDRRYEHLPMSLIEIDPNDVQAVADAVGLLGSPHAPPATTDAVDAFASDLIHLLPGHLASVAILRAAAICQLKRAVRIIQVTGSDDTDPDTAALGSPSRRRDSTSF